MSDTKCVKGNRCSICEPKPTWYTVTSHPYSRAQLDGSTKGPDELGRVLIHGEVVFEGDYWWASELYVALYEIAIQGLDR